MPIPFLFIGAAALTGAVGIGGGVKAGIDQNKAQKINMDANEMVQYSGDRLELQKECVSNALKALGNEKVFILNNSISEFLETFRKIKNVDLRDSAGLDELKHLHVDLKDFDDMQLMVNFAGALAGGTVAGIGGGALVAFGAYGAAQALAVASTGTAIASLSGVAATNATLAFFGGGSLAAGGLGMAGGTVVLGGLVAGPALMAAGLIAGVAAHKNLEKAKINNAEAMQICEQLDAGSLQCEAIRRRTYMFYTLLARLDTYFMPLIYRMEDILKNEGDDYRQYMPGSKKVIASCAATAVTMKTVLDTPLLTDDGLLTGDSEHTVKNTLEYIGQLA